MADPLLYKYPSPLKGYERLPALSKFSEIHRNGPDAKSFVNAQSNVLSKAYQSFTDPIDNGRRGGFDIHVYFFQSNREQVTFAHALWERIRHEFPELRIYRICDRPIEPHTMAMFEVNLFTPAQFGAFIPWLIINRGPLSALVHPNTEEEERDHTQRATWMGEKMPLDMGIFTSMRATKAKLQKVKVEREEETGEQ